MVISIRKHHEYWKSSVKQPISQSVCEGAFNECMTSSLASSWTKSKTCSCMLAGRVPVHTGITYTNTHTFKGQRIEKRWDQLLSLCSIDMRIVMIMMTQRTQRVRTVLVRTKYFSVH